MSLQIIINDPPQEHLETVVVETSPETPQPKKNLKIRWFLGLLAFVVILMAGLSGGFLYLHYNRIISPLGEARRILGFGDIVEKPNKIVYGFLPYWNYKYIDQLDLNQLTHLALFGLSFNEDGTIQRRELDYMEPGWRNLTSEDTVELIQQAHNNDVLVTVTLTAFDNDTIESIISDPNATETMVDEVIAYVYEYDLDGINIDFEYVGSPNQKVRTQFTNMVRTLSTRVKTLDSDLHVSISVYADSANNDRIWELEPLGQTLDHIIIMAYDFYRPTSDTVGPVAPVFGAGQGWNQDIVSLLSQHLKINPPSKLVLGVPFYGYEWESLDGSYLSPSTSRGYLATYDRVKDLLRTDKTIQRNWNNQALSPWIAYTEDEINYQIYYDDVQSLGFKYDLVNQTNLGGIGIWALGYEGNSPEIWNLVRDKF